MKRVPPDYHISPVGTHAGDRTSKKTVPGAFEVPRKLYGNLSLLGSIPGPRPLCRAASFDNLVGAGEQRRGGVGGERRGGTAVAISHCSPLELREVECSVAYKRPYPTACTAMGRGRPEPPGGWRGRRAERRAILSQFTGENSHASQTAAF